MQRSSGKWKIYPLRALLSMTFEAERKYICWLQMYQGIHTSEEKRTIKRHKAFEEKMLMSKSIQTGKQKRIGKFWSCLPMAEHGRLMATKKLIEFLIIQFLKEWSAPLSALEVSSFNIWTKMERGKSPAKIGSHSFKYVLNRF